MTAVQSWIDTIADPTIRNDLAAGAADGEISYADALKLLSDLDKSLARTDSGLSAQQLADLQCVASHADCGVTTDSYVQQIFADVVAGNPDLPSANLAVGSSADQLDSLIGKWFLGTDLPSLPAGIRYPVTYQAIRAPLYGPAGPRIDDVNQGALGDCYFEASVAEVLWQNPTLITSRIRDNGNNTYGVMFYNYGSGNEDWITVDNELPVSGGTLAFNHPANPHSGLWADLIEKAYAQLTGNSWNLLYGGGTPGGILKQLTNTMPTIDYFENNPNAFASIDSALKAKHDVVLCSHDTDTDDATGQVIYGGHFYSVVGDDPTRQQLILRNPWGGPMQNFSMSFLTAEKDYVYVDAATAPTPMPSTQSNPSLEKTVQMMVQTMASLPSPGLTGAPAAVLAKDYGPSVLLAAVQH